MAHPDITTIAKIAAPRLIRFLITITLRCLLIGQTKQGSFLFVILNFLPIISLWIFVGKGTAGNRIYSYTKLIMLGLVFSCIGDILFNCELMEPGMASFAVAMICYISAFGFHPVRPWLGLPFYAWGAVSVALMFNNFSTFDKICFPFYCILLMTMCWRALARIDSTENILRMASGIGSVLFVISRYSPNSNAKLVIMLTYYLAQLGIALSVLEE